MLGEQPVEIDAMMATDRDTASAIARLQRHGLVIYNGFTPSDAAHVLGLSSHWNREAGLHQHRKLDLSNTGSLTGLLADLVRETSHTTGETPASGSFFQLCVTATATGRPGIREFLSSADDGETVA